MRSDAVNQTVRVTLELPAQCVRAIDTLRDAQKVSRSEAAEYVVWRALHEGWIGD